MKQNVPRPCLLCLKEDSDRRIVKTWKERKVDDVADILIHLCGEIKDETWRVRNIPVTGCELLWRGTCLRTHTLLATGLGP